MAVMWSPRRRMMIGMKRRVNSVSVYDLAAMACISCGMLMSTGQIKWGCVL